MELWRNRNKNENTMTVIRSGHNNGFTLIEIVIAIFILIVGLLGVVSVTYMVIHGNSFSKTMTTATTLAKDKMEELKNAKYGDLTAGIVTENNVESIYTRIRTVINDSPDPGMKSISVQVVWNWKGTSHNVTLSSIVAQ